MKYNSQYQFFEKLMSIFGIRLVDLYKRLTPRDKVPIVTSGDMLNASIYQLHVDRQSLYSLSDETYQKFQMIFRILMLKQHLLLRGLHDPFDAADGFRCFTSANYVIYDKKSFNDGTEVSICGIDALSSLNILDNDVCQLVEQWTKLDINDMPCKREFTHLSGSHDQVLQYINNKSAHGSTLGGKSALFMKQYNILKSSIFVMVSKQSSQQIQLMKSKFESGGEIPTMNIEIIRYFVDIVYNLPELIVDKIMIETVGDERAYSTTQYKKQWDQFEKKYEVQKNGTL